MAFLARALRHSNLRLSSRCLAVAASCRWISPTAAAGSPESAAAVAPADPELPPPREPVGGARVELPPRVMAPPNPPLHRLPRLTQVSREMASSSLVKGEEFGIQDRRRIMTSAKDPNRTSKDSRFSPGKHFPITRSMNNEDNMSAIKEFIASRTTVEVTDGKQDLCEVADGEEDEREATQDMIGSRSSGAGVQSAGEVSDDQERCPADISTCYPCDCVAHLLLLWSSSHRDGSIYTDRYYWQKSFNVADRKESK